MHKGDEEVCSCLGTILTWPHIDALKEEDALGCVMEGVSVSPGWKSDTYLGPGPLSKRQIPQSRCSMLWVKKTSV